VNGDICENFAVSVVCHSCEARKSTTASAPPGFFEKRETTLLPPPRMLARPPPSNAGSGATSNLPFSLEVSWLSP
jgi:hypothetical protein